MKEVAQVAYALHIFFLPDKKNLILNDKKLFKIHNWDRRLT